MSKLSPRAIELLTLVGHSCSNEKTGTDCFYVPTHYMYKGNPPEVIIASGSGDASTFKSLTNKGLISPVHPGETVWAYCYYITEAGREALKEIA